MPASITIALVASRPKVTGSRMLMPDSGPIPGSTPTRVPTTQPRKPYHSTSGRSATEKPSIRLSTVVPSIASEPEQALLQRRLERHREQDIGRKADAEAEGRGGEEVAPFQRDQHEQQQRHGDDEAERRIERDRHGGDREHARGMG